MQYYDKHGHFLKPFRIGSPTLTAASMAAMPPEFSQVGGCTPVFLLFVRFAMIAEPSQPKQGPKGTDYALFRNSIRNLLFTIRGFVISNQCSILGRPIPATVNTWRIALHRRAGMARALRRTRLHLGIASRTVRRIARSDLRNPAW